MDKKLPQISGKNMGRLLVRLGFYLKSQKGSHMKFVREYETGKEIIIVPNHKILRKGTLNSIFKKVDLHALNDLKELMK